MTTRIECDFRHGLAEPMIARTPTGPILSLVHGQESITVAMSESSLRALWLAVAAVVHVGEK